MAYELFQRSAIRVETPTVSIAPGGRIAINAAGCRLLADAGVKSVALFWDKTRNKIALRAAQSGEKNAFSVSFLRGSSGSIAAKSFLRYIGWSAPTRQALATTWNAKEKMFEATLPVQFLAGSGKFRKI